jgi:hypothetical protein
VNPFVVRLLRAVILLMVLGVLITQAWVLPDIAGSLSIRYPEVAHLHAPALTVSIIDLTAAHVVLVCVWRLLTMVRTNTVFSADAFRWVDVIIGAAGAAGALTLGLLLWLGSQTTETGMQPGIALLLLGCVVLATGVALVVAVLRALLAKAVGLKDEAGTLQAELDEVI